MNKLRNIIIAVAALAVSACHYVSPDAGQEAVLIQKPYLFGHGGVVDTPVKTGAELVALSTSAVYVDVKPVQYTVEFDDLMSKDGIPLDFNSAIRLQVTDTVDLIKRYGPDWYKTNVDNAYRELVRQAVRKYGMNEVAIDTNAIDQIDNQVTQGMQRYLKSASLPVRLVSLTVGKANPPELIKNQRIRTAEEQQRQITEAQTKLAEDARKEAETARAIADNAYRQQMSLSPEQFVDLQRIGMQRDVCMKGGCTFINGNATPVLSSR